VDDFILYGMAAAVQAVRDSGWEPAGPRKAAAHRRDDRVGHRGADLDCRNGRADQGKGPKRVSPFFIPGALINLISGQVSIRFRLQGAEPCGGDGLFHRRACHWRCGAADPVGRCRCDGGGRRGKPDLRIGIAGFNACKALSTKRADDPTKASRPYDADRDGFVMGEGAGVVVLEEYEHAKARGAKIYAEVLGYGLSGDAYHITAPSEDGDGGYRSMAAALKRAGLGPAIWITSTRMAPRPWPTRSSLGAVERLMGDAAARATMSVDQIEHRASAGCCGRGRGDLLRAGDPRPDGAADDQPGQSGGDTRRLDLAPNKAVKRKIDVALSNSFGFGGTNASLMLGKVAG
jgi:3-oxoacyl-[acyl-carrier-protein] synthase II